MDDSPNIYPSILEVQTLGSTPSASVEVPGSKSITNRALILAALCCPVRCPRLFGCLFSEDTEVMINALRQLGLRVEIDRSGIEPCIAVSRDDLSRRLIAPADLFVANSG